MGRPGFVEAVVRTVQDDLIQSLWSAAATRHDGAGLEGGACMEGTVLHLSKERSLENGGRSALLETFLAAACWPKQRKVLAGLTPPGNCDRCGLEPDDMAHLLYRCPVTKALEHEDVLATDALCEQAVAGCVQLPCLWLRGILPESLVVVDAPLDAVDMFTVGVVPDGPWPATTYFTDGSGGEHSSCVKLRRCGVGVAVLNFCQPLPQLLWGACWALAGQS